jgi:hypothetical protein
MGLTPLSLSSSSILAPGLVAAIVFPLAVTLVGQSGTPAIPSTRPPAVELVDLGLEEKASPAALLDQYEHGDHDAAVRGAVRVGPGGFENFGRALAKDAPAWVAQNPGSDLARRRLIVAVFALDVAAGFAEASKSLAPETRPPVRQLIEWACRFLRSDSTSTPLERLWFEASVELAVHVDPTFVYGFNHQEDASATQQAREREYGASVDHLAHAESRVPEDPRLLFIAAQRPGGGPGPHAWTPPSAIDSLISQRREMTRDEAAALERQGAAAERAAALSGEPPGPSGILIERASRILGLERASRELLPLAQAPSIRARANLELGCIALCFRDDDLARRYLDDIDEWTSDARVKYLGHFIRGRVDELDGRRGEMERDYRAALTFVPWAGSATTKLATLLWLEDRGPEATALVDDELTHPSVDDPWALGLFMDEVTDWPALREELRAGLR